MKIIGLTGGIGSGKSTVSDYLKSRNYLILDADEISRNLTKKDGEALPDIKNIFGEKVFNSDGTLDRKALAEIVFNDKEKLKLLEKVTTDKVNDIIINEIKKLKDLEYENTIFLDVPLLFESGDDKLCHETWLVTCDYEVKIKRLMARDNTTKENILKRMENQLNDQEKIKLATHVIDNSRDLGYLYEQIDKLL